MACKKEEGRELLHSPALLLLAPIHLSAWNRNSRKFAFTEFSDVGGTGSHPISATTLSEIA
jgi:hypothetical protein